MAKLQWRRLKAMAVPSATGRGRLVGLRVGPRLPAVGVRCRLCARHALPQRPGDMSV